MAEPAADREGAEATEPPDFEGLLVRAGYNYHVFLASMFGFARERGSTIHEFVAWTAAHVASTWSGLQGHGADAVLRVVLENLASTGYPVTRVELGAALSRASVGVVPLGLDEVQWRDLLAPFGATPEEMRALFGVFAPLVEAAGAALEIEEMADVEQPGGAVRLTVRRELPPVGPQPVRFFE